MEPLEYLQKIESHGFSCYIVGGYVRDYLSGISSTDVDIATSAHPKDIVSIFDLDATESLGCVSIRDSKYTIDITTYRRETSYECRHPSIEYIESIDEDLTRRDFTMNAICLDSKGNIYDPLNGHVDLKKRLIRVIGDVETKFKEDPLRILRAMRLSIVYDFAIEKKALEFILANKELLSQISFARKKSEMDKILLAKNSERGLAYLKSSGLLEALEIEVPLSYHSTKDLLGCWAQLKCPKYPFSKLEKTRMSNIESILEKGHVDRETLYLYDIYDNLVAGEILEYDHNAILELYETMPVHRDCDLALDGSDIMSILGIKSGPIIKEIKKDLLRQVISGNLPNSDSELSNYIRKNWK